MTKTQARRKARYLKQLHKCGFRSWKQANARRHVLIRVHVSLGVATPAEIRELLALQKLTGYYQDYKTKGSLQAAGRKLRRILTKLEGKA